MGPGILAIDQGTSGTKALVVDECGEVLSCAEIPVSLHALGDGGVQQDPRELLESVLAAGRQAIAESSVEVVAAGLANQGETVLAWDGSTGEALSPAISWQDRRSADFVATLAEHEARLTQITGLPLDPYFIAPKLRWLKDRSPSGARVTSLDAWLNWHLIARAVTDVATASRSLVLDLDTRTWSEEAAGIFGLDVAAFPEIVTNAADFGVKNVFSNPKPLELLRGLLQIGNAKGDDWILDFFAGSGTTGMACAYEGRAFIGVERDAAVARFARDAPGGHVRLAGRRRWHSGVRRIWS